MSWPSKTSTGRDSLFSRNELLTAATILFCRDLLGPWSSLSLRAPHTEHLEGLLIRVRELMDLVRGDEDDILLRDTSRRFGTSVNIVRSFALPLSTYTSCS